MSKRRHLWGLRSAKPGESGTPTVDCQYPTDTGDSPSALRDTFRCADEEQIMRILIRKDRFARREPGMVGETLWRVEIPEDAP
jgi:hypothetical protein